MALIVSILIPLIVGGLAGVLTMNSMSVYESLILPPLAPAPWVFPVVWTILYILMGVASWLVYRSDAPQDEKKGALKAYAVQLAVNFIWPILFFKLESYFTAFLWLVLLVILILVTIVRFARIDRRAAWLLAPYLLWTVFAGYLNLFIWLLNK
ncbi:TspO/MBR family protein [Agathobaculum sp.]|uniref:TspO/MBR family protein n=1 Tax=Agathobaculum sp. TaxID=2048138 RepID=UPI002A82186F|nr:TspO/MBR family protein [Agathobaculum sp.]MDY3619294.1 TspO/MBR family protein [Agathobaculum sp.]